MSKVGRGAGVRWLGRLCWFLSPENFQVAPEAAMELPLSPPTPTHAPTYHDCCLGRAAHVVERQLEERSLRLANHLHVLQEEHLWASVCLGANSGSNQERQGTRDQLACAALPLACSRASTKGPGPIDSPSGSLKMRPLCTAMSWLSAVQAQQVQVVHACW